MYVNKLYCMLTNTEKNIGSHSWILVLRLINTNNFVPLKDASIVVFACLPSLNYCLIVVFVMADHADLIVSLFANLWRYHAGGRGEQQLSGFGDCLKNKYIQISDSMHNFHGFADFKV